MKVLREEIFKYSKAADGYKAWWAIHYPLPCKCSQHHIYDDSFGFVVANCSPTAQEKVVEGVRLFKENKYHSAISLFSMAIFNGPDVKILVKALYNRARAQYECGIQTKNTALQNWHVKKTLEDCLFLLEHDPEHYKA